MLNKTNYIIIVRNLKIFVLILIFVNYSSAPGVNIPLGYTCPHYHQVILRNLHEIVDE